MIKASIIIPVFNEGDNISACLQALSHLTASGELEVIVVDGGSTDDTVAKASCYTHHVIVSEKGRGRQMNKGASVASGDYLFFLHVDSYLPKHFFNELNKIDQQKPAWGFFKIALDDTNWQFRVIEWMINKRSCLTSIGTGDQALFMRRDVYEQLGGFEAIDLMEDVAFSKAAKKRSSRAFVINAVVTTSARRWRQHGIYKTIVLMWLLRLRYWLGQDPNKLAKLYR